MNPRALAILALADRGIQPTPDMEAGAACMVMLMDCLPYFRQRLDAEISQKAMYEARAQDVSLSERERHKAQGMLNALTLADEEISALEQGIDPHDAHMTNIPNDGNPFTIIYAWKFVADPPPKNSPYFKRRSVQQYLPHWHNENWVTDPHIVERLYQNWLKRGRKNHEHNRPA